MRDEPSHCSRGHHVHGALTGLARKSRIEYHLAIRFEHIFLILDEPYYVSIRILQVETPVSHLSEMGLRSTALRKIFAAKIFKTQPGMDARRHARTHRSAGTK